MPKELLVDRWNGVTVALAMNKTSAKHELEESAYRASVLDFSRKMN